MTLRRTRIVRGGALTAVVVVYFVMAMSGVSHKSGTFDEVAHVTAGFSYWAHDDFRLDPENGNWPQRFVALPLILGGYTFPTLDQTAWRESDMWTMGDQFLYGAGNDADSMLRLSRMMVAIVGALLGVLVYFWSRQLFGEPGGWLSLLVFVFSPSMLAHGALATSDMFAAAFFTAAVAALWALLHRITPWTLAASVLATSGLFLSKMSAPLLIPMALIMVGLRVVIDRPLGVRWRGVERQIHGRRKLLVVFLALAAAHAAIAFLVIWASYDFRYRALVAGTTGQEAFIDYWAELLAQPSIPVRMAQWGREHRVLPEAYLYGLSSVVAYAKNRAAFFNGEVTIGGGWRWFFPYAALVKTTLPALLLLAFVPVALSAKGISDGETASPATSALRRAAHRLYDLAPLLILLGVYGTLALMTSLNIGHRHLLPMIPAAIVLLGASAAPIRVFLHRRQRIRSEPPHAAVRLHQHRTAIAASVVGALLCWHAIESVRIAPHYLAYFNVFAGGPRNAYRHLVDSSLDWGQDLPGLKAWLDREGLQGANHQPVFLSYFGTARPDYYGIDAKPLPGFFDRWTPRAPEPLTAGVYCISATMLQAVYLKPYGRWTSEYEDQYQVTLENLKTLERTSNDAAARAALLRQTGEDFWWKAFHAFEQLRFARLAAYLRAREPDAAIGYSILIYRLTDSDIRTALFAPNR